MNQLLANSISPVVSVEGPSPFLQLAGDARFKFVTVRFPVANLAPDLAGYRILFLTDVHLRNNWEPVLDSFLARFREARPNLVLIGGDFVDNKSDHRPALRHVRRLLRELKSDHGTYAVTGNHDGPLLPGHLEGSPVNWLNHHRALVGPPESPVELVGLAGYKAVLFEETLARVPAKVAGVPRIVLSHYGWLIRKSAPILQPDLYLAGHTHGGQVCLPSGRPLITHDRLPHAYAAGLHLWPHAGGECHLLVSRGLGFSNIQVRAFCPPEVHLIVLEPG